MGGEGRRLCMCVYLIECLGTDGAQGRANARAVFRLVARHLASRPPRELLLAGPGYTFFLFEESDVVVHAGLFVV